MSLPETVRLAAERVDRSTPVDRDRYADLIRVLAILVVVLGHWAAAVVLVDDDGELVATQILVVEPWTQVATWVVQVMPLFFLVGGRVNAGSLARARDRGERAAAWVRKRSRRLLRPMVPLLAIWVPLGPALAALGADESLVEEATETAFIPLWFLAVYLLVIVLAPATLWLHRRLGLPLIVGAVVLVGIVDVLDRAEIPAVGQANYVLVFGIAHQLGYLWANERLPSGGRALRLTGGGLIAALALVGFVGYPLSMVGLAEGEPSNATPPTLALVSLTFAQLGIVLTLRRVADRWLHAHPVPWAAVATGGAAILTVFLWHMTALVVVATLTHVPGWWPQLSEVDARWWMLRPAWLALCTVVLVPLVLLFRRLEGAGDPVPGGGAVTLGGVVATASGLTLMLNEGLYDAERATRVPLLALALMALGFLLLGIHHPTSRAKD